LPHDATPRSFEELNWPYQSLLTGYCDKAAAPLKHK